MPYASLGGGGKQGCVGGLLSGYGEVAERLWSAPPPALPLLLVFFSLARDEKSREHCREPPPAPPPVRPSPAHAHSLVVLQVELGDVAEEGAVAAAPRQRIDSRLPAAQAPRLGVGQHGRLPMWRLPRPHRGLRRFGSGCELPSGGPRWPRPPGPWLASRPAALVPHAQAACRVSCAPDRTGAAVFRLEHELGSVDRCQTGCLAAHRQRRLCASPCQRAAGQPQVRAKVMTVRRQCAKKIAIGCCIL